MTTAPADDSALPPEVWDADPNGAPEQTANTSTDADGPEGEVEDVE